jgi:hypothetical protein
MKTAIGVAAFLLLSISSAHASLLVFTDREAWEIAAAQKGQITTDDFESYSTGSFTELSSNLGDVSLTFNSLEKQHENWPMSAIHSESSGSFSNYYQSNYLQFDLDGNPQFDVTFGFLPKTYAFGFDFIGKLAWDDTHVEIADEIFSIVEEIGFKTSGFIGFLSSTTIDSALFFNAEISGARFGMDNLSVARAVNDNEEATMVSAPASLGILAISLLALVTRRRAN